MNPPSPSPVELQSHIYSSFLEAKTADVALHVTGSWHATYKLHRMVLIQSGFFQSLFMSGFIESKLETKLKGPHEIDIVFDDRNITRAAFEVCIARLYGGGPPLFVYPSLIPTPSQPLTPSFTTPSPPPEIPNGHHPATPRFLLSLLATAVYLSIPSIASQALSSILNTMGPHTVIPYLNSALGKPIEPLAADEPEAAVGLEHVAEFQRDDITEMTIDTVTVDIQESQDQTTDSMSQSFEDLDIRKENPSETSSDYSNADRNEPSYHYGAVSDKIGEAAACWLARWGVDMLSFEDKSFRRKDGPPSIIGSSMRRRAKTIPSSPTVTHFNNRSTSAPSAVSAPVIWARGGLDAKWIRALLSSDALFVKDERERYDFARAIIELRRRSGIDSAEEHEWAILFAQGIYFANMSAEDVIAISTDVSPTTGHKFVPLSVLQDAHWTQSLLRHRIVAKPSKPSTSLSASPPPAGEKMLGLAITTADVLTTLSAVDKASHLEKEKAYFPVPSDSSLRLGDNGGIEGATMDQLFELSTHSHDPKSASKINTSGSNFFGLQSERRPASSCIASDSAGKTRWSPYPPFRFAVEFWDVESLREKNRLHSQTIWYAGSLFNVYVQVVRKKGVQLGVYIHRQSSVDPIPPSSAPSYGLPRTVSDSPHSRGPSHSSNITISSSLPSVHYSPSIHPPSRSGTPLSPSPTAPQMGSPSLTAGSDAVPIPATAPSVMPLQPYRDPRPDIYAYFTISCASATGSSLTRFTSAPDVFSVSQSWGWKSSSLRTEEYLEVDQGGAVTGPDMSLRATVVLGLV